MLSIKKGSYPNAQTEPRDVHRVSDVKLKKKKKIKGLKLIVFLIEIFWLLVSRHHLLCKNTRNDFTPTKTSRSKPSLQLTPDCILITSGSYMGGKRQVDFPSSFRPHSIIHY